MLRRLLATHGLAEVMRHIKAGSSRWVQERHRRRSFAWQHGYAGLTVSPSRMPSVYSSIAHQPEHHRKKTFQEDYVEFLRESGIAYEERYLW